MNTPSPNPTAILAHSLPRAAPIARWWERALLYLLAAVIVGFGIGVERHVALSTNRHPTDLGVFLRAAAAVRQHQDIYQVSWHDDHYLYPPLLAILLSPFAPALPASGQPSGVGFAIAVGAAYVLSIACLLAAVHLLARSLEPELPLPAQPNDAARLLQRRWWILRALPIFVILHGLGRDLQLGQVEELLLLLLSCSLISTLRGRSVAGGFWLAGAICLKVIPAFLLIWPIVRRDARYLAGCAAGCIVGLVLVPLAALGPQRFESYSREYLSTFLLPGASRGSISVLPISATHNYSLLGVLHNLQYLSLEQRPDVPTPATRVVALIIGALLLLITLWVGGDLVTRRRMQPNAGAVHEALLFGQLIVLMLLIAPQFQSYYFTLLIPLIAALTAAGISRRGPYASYPSPRRLLLFAGFMVVGTMVSVRGLELLRDAGLPTLATLSLWAAALADRRRRA